MSYLRSSIVLIFILFCCPFLRVNGGDGFDERSSTGNPAEEELKADQKREVAESSEISRLQLNLEGSEVIPAESYVDLVSLKLLRGVTNIATGWGELPRQCIITGQEDSVWLFLPLSLSRGIGMTVYRTIIGAVETLFFFHSPDGTYSSLINPAFVWQKKNDNTRIPYPPMR
jgi:putative exosortase-associated protein (TIGR04073 family)